MLANFFLNVVWPCLSNIGEYALQNGSPGYTFDNLAVDRGYTGGNLPANPG